MKHDLYSGINDFQKCCQPKTNVVKHEKGDLLADSHSILNKWNNHFCQLLNMYWVDDVRLKYVSQATSIWP
jgi:hypothetical protein